MAKPRKQKPKPATLIDTTTTKKTTKCAYVMTPSGAIIKVPLLTGESVSDAVHRATTNLVEQDEWK